MTLPSALRVSFRYLESGTIEVPKRIHQEVEEWAIANWAWDQISHQSSALQGAIRGVSRFKEQIAAAKVLVEDLFRFIDSGDLQKAHDLYDNAYEGGSFHNGRYWPKSKRYYVKVDDLTKDTVQSKKKLKLYLKRYIEELGVPLQKEITRKEALESEIQWLKGKTGSRPRFVKEKVFSLEGDETKYAPLKGKSIQFTCQFGNISSGGSWDWETKTLTVARGIDEESRVKDVVRHELQHMMQNFLRDSLGYDSTTLTRDVGLGPRKTQTPWYTQQGQTTTGKKLRYVTDVQDLFTLHELDDIEFHTELEDARSALRFQLASRGLEDMRKIFKEFLGSNSFLLALQRVPEARGKYRVALKELAKVLDEPGVMKSRL